MIVYLKSFEFTTKSRSHKIFFRGKKKKKGEIVEIGQVQTRSNLFEILDEESAKKLWSTMT